MVSGEEPRRLVDAVRANELLARLATCLPGYRFARIGDLTGYDLRDVDVRFNLHRATRAWRFSLRQCAFVRAALNRRSVSPRRGRTSAADARHKRPA